MIATILPIKYTCSSLFHCFVCVCVYQTKMDAAYIQERQFPLGCHKSILITLYIGINITLKTSQNSSSSWSNLWVNIWNSKISDYKTDHNQKFSNNKTVKRATSRTIPSPYEEEIQEKYPIYPIHYLWNERIVTVYNKKTTEASVT